MADISQYLQAILDAVYGEQVRGSIHDAIELINDVSEVVISAGTAITGPTSSSTGFYEDSLYINTSTCDLWKCIGTDAWSNVGNLKGIGISSLEKTSTSGNVDTYTITFDDGSTEIFNVTNGIDGTNGSTWYKGTALTGTGSAITGFPGVINDFYLNSDTGGVYVCTKTGAAMVPDAAEWDYVMTLTGGGGGGSVVVIDNLNSGSSTDALSANQGRVLKGLVDQKQDAGTLATVATSGSYNDLSDKPTIPSVSVSYSGTATQSTVKKQVINVNSTSYDVDGTVYMEGSGTSASFVFVNADYLIATAAVSVFVNDPADNYQSITLDDANHQVTVTFTESKSRSVRLYIK